MNREEYIRYVEICSKKIEDLQKNLGELTEGTEEYNEVIKNLEATNKDMIPYLLVLNSYDAAKKSFFEGNMDDYNFFVSKLPKEIVNELEQELSKPEEEKETEGTLEPTNEDELEPTESENKTVYMQQISIYKLLEKSESAKFDKYIQKYLNNFNEYFKVYNNQCNVINKIYNEIQELKDQYEAATPEEAKAIVTQIEEKKSELKINIVNFYNIKLEGIYDIDEAIKKLNDNISNIQSAFLDYKLANAKINGGVLTEEEIEDIRVKNYENKEEMKATIDILKKIKNNIKSSNSMILKVKQHVTRDEINKYDKKIPVPIISAKEISFESKLTRVQVDRIDKAKPELVKSTLSKIKDNLKNHPLATGLGVATGVATGFYLGAKFRMGTILLTDLVALIAKKFVDSKSYLVEEKSLILEETEAPSKLKEACLVFLSSALGSYIVTSFSTRSILNLKYKSSMKKAEDAVFEHFYGVAPKKSNFARNAALTVGGAAALGATAYGIDRYQIYKSKNYILHPQDNLEENNIEESKGRGAR